MNIILCTNTDRRFVKNGENVERSIKNKGIVFIACKEMRL